LFKTNQNRGRGVIEEHCSDALPKTPLVRKLENNVPSATFPLGFHPSACDYSSLPLASMRVAR
jgi:hypothetical protein